MSEALVFEADGGLEVEVERWSSGRDRLRRAVVEPVGRLWALTLESGYGFRLLSVLAEAGVILGVLEALEAGRKFSGPAVGFGSRGCVRVVPAGGRVELEVRTGSGFERCSLPAEAAAGLGRLRGRLAARLLGELAAEEP